MKEDDDDKRLLEAIQRVAQEHDPLSDPRWDALAAGTLSETEEAALRDEAKRSPAIAEAYDLLRPFDAATKAAMIARLPAPTPAASRPRRWRRLGAALLAAAVLVAAPVVWFTLRPAGRPPLEPVPAYSITVSPGEQTMLGATDDAGVPPFLQDPESYLKITLRPDTRVEGVIAVRAWRVRDHRATRWDPPMDKRPDGVVLIAGTKQELFGGIPAGSLEIVFAVGREGALPGDAEILTEALRSADRPAREQPYWILRTRVELRDVKTGHSGPGAWPPTSPAPPPPFEVEFAGCASVRALGAGVAGQGNMACEIPANQTLTLWVKAPPQATIIVDAPPMRRPGAWHPPLIAVTTDAATSPETGMPMQGGRRIAVRVPDSAKTLTVTTEQGGPHASYSLRLLPREPVAALERAKERRQAEPKEAKELIHPLLSDDRTWVRGQALGMLARFEKKFDKKRELFEEAMALHRKAGWISEEVNDNVTFVNDLIRAGAIPEARRVLARIEPLEAQFPEGRALALHYRARLDFSVGNLRSALRFFDASKEIAERLDYKAHLADVVEGKAELLRMLGRSVEAMELDARGDALTRHARPCQRAQFLDNWGWHAILAAESLEGVAADLPDPLPMLREALSLYQGSCIQPTAKANNLTNLAIAAIDRHHVDEARDYLEQARKALPKPYAELQAWQMLVEARIALAIGQPEQALRAYEKSAEISAGNALHDLRVRSALGLAEVLDALGRTNEARQAYSEADALLDSWSLSAPLGEGRGTFLARYEASTRKRVDFLLRGAERQRAPKAWSEEAASAARNGRARILGSLQWLDRVDAFSPSERARWEKALDEYRSGRTSMLTKLTKASELPRDIKERAEQAQREENKRLHDAFEEALSMTPRAAGAATQPMPPAPGEVILLCQPVQEGWVGFAITRDRVVFHRLAKMATGARPEQIAEQLLDAFSDVLEGAERIRFAPHGRLSRVDFHRLVWRGRPLLERFTVTYGVDLPRERAAAPAQGPSPLAILVADPRSDAPLAVLSASHVAKALQNGGWRVERIEREAATHEAVRAALEKPGVELFFYAGHGLHQGRDGWESGLRLNDDAWFTVVDVMALSRVPPRVVLAGCETAKTSDATPVEGLGLAQAFVAAGASEVVATSRVVRVDLAERVMRALFKEEGGALAGRDLPAALRAAQRAVAQDTEPGDWAAFRVLVP